jgi:hypothetical protein
MNGGDVRETIKAGDILIKEGTRMPESVRIESEPGVPGWKLVSDLDGYAFDRMIRNAGWNFFCLAGDIKATVFGIDEQQMVRRAIERILANPRSENFNSLEITRVTSTGSVRFPLVHYVTVSAQSRHIQKGMFLSRSQEVPELVTNSDTASRGTGIARNKIPLLQKPTKQSSAASALSH